MLTYKLHLVCLSGKGCCKVPFWSQGACQWYHYNLPEPGEGAMFLWGIATRWEVLLHGSVSTGGSGVEVRPVCERCDITCCIMWHYMLIMCHHLHIMWHLCLSCDIMWHLPWHVPSCEIMWPHVNYVLKFVKVVLLRAVSFLAIWPMHCAWHKLWYSKIYPTRRIVLPSCEW